MQKIADGLVLYHGSYCEVPAPDLGKCAKQKDFGQGFYLTTSREQAVKFLNIALSKAKTVGLIDPEQVYGFISTYTVHRPGFVPSETDWLYHSILSLLRNL